MTYRSRCAARLASKRRREWEEWMHGAGKTWTPVPVLRLLVREMTSGKEFPELSSVDMSEWTLIEPARVAPAPAKSDQEEWDQ